MTMTDEKSLGIEFTDEEPPASVQQTKRDWKAIVEQAAKNPGKWAKVKDVSSPMAYSLRRRYDGSNDKPRVETRMADVSAGKGTLWLRVIAKR